MRLWSSNTGTISQRPTHNIKLISKQSVDTKSVSFVLKLSKQHHCAHFRLRL